MPRSQQLQCPHFWFSMNCIGRPDREARGSQVQGVNGMFRRKGEGSSETTETGPAEVDLSPLNAEENPVVEAVENITRRGEAAAKADPIEAAVPRKKRYYSPSEVRRKKGCIGCGGMVLAVPLLVSVAGIAVALF